MLRSLIVGFLLGPLVLLAVVLLWSKAGLAVVIAGGVLLGALVVAALAGAVVGGALRPRVPAPPEKLAANRLSAESPGTFAAGGTPAADYIGRENLASANPWRRRFTGWRYTTHPHDK